MFKVGDYICNNDRPDATIFMVHRVQGERITYVCADTSRWGVAGVEEASKLKHATEQQLNQEKV